jgi:hypothetical protein
MARQREGGGEAAAAGGGGAEPTTGEEEGALRGPHRWGEEGGGGGEGREGLHIWERKMKKLHGQQWREAHRRRRSSPEPRKKSSIGGIPIVGSTNRKHWDKALDETNTVVL